MTSAKSHARSHSWTPFFANACPSPVSAVGRNSVLRQRDRHLGGVGFRFRPAGYGGQVAIPPRSRLLPRI